MPDEVLMKVTFEASMEVTKAEDIQTEDAKDES